MSCTRSTVWSGAGLCTRRMSGDIASKRWMPCRPTRPVRTFRCSPVSAQVVCCIDDREESFRRHLEEIAPDLETFSAAGFFSAAMYFRVQRTPHFTPLCPIVVRPQQWVTEEVVLTWKESHQLRKRARRMFGRATHQVHVGTRSFAGGALLATVLGPLASLPMVARILFPRATARLRKLAGRLVKVPPVTTLRLERTEPDAGPRDGHVGYSLDEMSGIVERLLRDLGLTSNFARLVLIVGHGSSSLNNPHESAYNCGACAGSRGGPNARAVAQMANDPRVREQVAERGIVISSETVFLGAFHNTCDEGVLYFDLDRLPVSHHDDFGRLRAVVDECGNAMHSSAAGGLKCAARPVAGGGAVPCGKSRRGFGRAPSRV